MLDNNQIFLTSSDLISDIGMTPFHYLFSNFNHNISLNRVIGELLFEHSDNKLLNAYNNEHWGAIHVAVRRGSIKCIEWILQKNNEKKDNKKFSLNLKGKDNWTPLHLTANSGNVILTSLLLKNDANVFARTITNKTPRDVCNNNKQIYKLLLLYENTLLNVLPSIVIGMVKFPPSAVIAVSVDTAKFTRLEVLLTVIPFALLIVPMV